MKACVGRQSIHLVLKQDLNNDILMISMHDEDFVHKYVSSKFVNPTLTATQCECCKHDICTEREHILYYTFSTVNIRRLQSPRMLLITIAIGFY